MGIESPLASCRRSINEYARPYAGTRDGPLCARPMKTCYVPSWVYSRIVSCSADDDVRCSGGTATMLTSDVLHGHARRQPRRCLIVTSYPRLHLASAVYGGVQFRCMHTTLHMHVLLQRYFGGACAPCPAGQNNDAFRHKSNEPHEAERPIVSGD